MPSQKIENLLQLSLEVPETSRERSDTLSTGYEPLTNQWEIVFKYSGDAEGLTQRYSDLTFLYGGYAIARLTREQINELAAEPTVEYIEMPKPLHYSVYNAKLTSCIPPVQRNPWNLTGRGVLVAIVDSGIDILHPDFRNEDGSTRLVGLWDQTSSVGYPPDGYRGGVYFTREQLDDFIAMEESPSIDLSGHGTHVMGIAAGNGRASRGEQRGIAYEADLLAVKLRGGSGEGESQTAAMMMGIDFCVRTAIERRQPVALNLSYGNSYGSHDGTSLLETYLDTVAAIGRTTICIGSGNEGNKARHSSLQLKNGEDYLIEFIVSPGEFDFGIQLWKNFSDRFQVRLESPDGSSVILTENMIGGHQYVIDGTEILVYMGQPSPYSVSQEIYMEFIPYGVETMVRSGIWRIILSPVEIVEGGVNLWLPSGNRINSETEFLIPSSETTLTIPSTAFRPITVGAYNSNSGSFAAFSGQGTSCGSGGSCKPLVFDLVNKPDLVAPGVGIISCAPGGGYTARTGTSMACPFVTGSAALLMQYGVINGQDPYLYGEKIKAFLERGARPLSAFSQYPNASTGWGKLCLRDSLL